MPAWTSLQLSHLKVICANLAYIKVMSFCLPSSHHISLYFLKGLYWTEIMLQSSVHQFSMWGMYICFLLLLCTLWKSNHCFVSTSAISLPPNHKPQTKCIDSAQHAQETTLEGKTVRNRFLKKMKEWWINHRWLPMSLIILKKIDFHPAEGTKIFSRIQIH